MNEDNQIKEARVKIAENIFELLKIAYDPDCIVMAIKKRAELSPNTPILQYIASVPMEYLGEILNSTTKTHYKKDSKPYVANIKQIIELTLCNTNSNKEE